MATSTTGMFGPRSVRFAAAIISLIAASWCSFNIPVAGTGVGFGLVFCVALFICVASFRLLLAHTVDDLCIGVNGVALASSTLYILEGGTREFPPAITIALVALGAGLVSGWSMGRYRGQSS